MYSTSPVINENKTPPICVGVWSALSGLILPIMTGVQYIIPYRTYTSMYAGVSV